MICILAISDRGNRFQIRYLERSPQPKVKEIGLPSRSLVIFRNLPSCSRGDSPLWAEQAIANWLAKN